jgi:hypothetical protein
MPAVFTVANRPQGYDQTRNRYTLYGTSAITGTYTNGTGIAATFTNSIDLAGNPFTLPPTYTGANGPGQGVPANVWTQPPQAYIINFVAGYWRIYSAAGTELSTGTVPAAVSAAGIPTAAEFLRG